MKVVKTSVFSKLVSKLWDLPWLIYYIQSKFLCRFPKNSLFYEMLLKYRFISLLTDDFLEFFKTQYAIYAFSYVKFLTCSMLNFEDELHHIFWKIHSLENNWVMKRLQINGKFKRKKAEISGRISCLVLVTSQQFQDHLQKVSKAVFSALAHAKWFKIRNKHCVQ